jgi:hypothetical protein
VDFPNPNALALPRTARFSTPGAMLKDPRVEIEIRGFMFVPSKFSDSRIVWALARLKVQNTNPVIAIYLNEFIEHAFLELIRIFAY